MREIFNAPTLADAFEPHWDIDAAADNLIPLDQHVAEVDAMRKDSLRPRRLRVPSTAARFVEMFTSPSESDQTLRTFGMRQSVKHIAS